MVVETLVPVGLIAAFAVAGAFVTRSGVQNYQLSQAISDAVAFDERTSADGLVSITGIVSGPAGEQPFESELGGTPCVAYRYKITKKQSANPNENVSNSPRVRFDRGAGEDAVPFTIDADGQSIHVDASDAHIDWSNVRFERISAGQVIRNRSGWRAILVALRRFGRSKNERRDYHEACLEIGDEVTVIGTAQTGRDEVAATFQKGNGSPLVVATTETASVAAGFRKRATSRFMGAAVFFGIAIVVVLFWAGML